MNGAPGDESGAAGPPTGIDSGARNLRRDRIAGLFCLIIAISAGFLAAGFRVGFLTDPIGPRALPWLAAALLGIGGALLIGKPAPSRATAGPAVSASVALAIGTFVLYAITVAFAGFVLSTTLLMAVLARFYGGRWKAGLAAGGIFAVSLWLLFAYALGVPLPVGSIFTVGG